MGVRDRLARLIGGKELEARFNLGQYPQFLQDYYTQFGYAGSLYPLQLNQTITGWQKKEEISGSLPNYTRAIMKSPPAYAAQMVRASVMSQARLVWRNRIDRHIFRTNDLQLLERPWVNGTTGELLAKMEWHVGLAGNAYVYRQSAKQLRVLRPDWVGIVYGSQSEPEDPKGALDSQVVGYVYVNGGFTGNYVDRMTMLLPEEVAHWSPLPDPMSPGLGMSWLTPALRDIQQDEQALEYKIGFFTNGATPNLVIKGLPATTATQLQEWVDKMEANHKGAVNAFKTIYLAQGADATVVGSNLQQLDLSSITSHGETRISYLSRVPAVILGIAAGLKGSSLNAGNYAEARRNFIDSWYFSELQNACAALGSIVNVPGGAELWYDTADVPLLRDDALIAAQVEQLKEQTIVAYVQAGFTPESAVGAVQAQDIGVLQHDPRFISVQLQALAAAKPAQPAESNQPKAAEPPAARSIEQREEIRPFVVTPNVTVNIPERSLSVPAPTVNVDARQIEQPAPVVNVTVPMPELHLEQPITVNTPAIEVEPPDVNVTVQPSAAPEVRIEQPINVAAPSVTLEQPINVAPAAVTIEPADINIEAPVTVNVPADEPKAVDVVYDGDKVVGVRPRSRRKR